MRTTIAENIDSSQTRVRSHNTMQMNEWDRTEMGFPRALADFAASQHATAEPGGSGSSQPTYAHASAYELTSTWLEVFDDSADSI